MPAEYSSESANTEDLQFNKREIYVSAISALNPMQIMDHWSSPKGEPKILLTELVYADVPFLQSFHATSAVSLTKDPYTALGLDKSASLSDIKKAYYAMAKKYHPDTNIKVQDLIPVQNPDLLAERLVEVDLEAGLEEGLVPILTSRISLGRLPGKVGEQGGHDSLHSRRMSWLVRTSKCKQTYPSWMRQWERVRI